MTPTAEAVERSVDLQGSSTTDSQETLNQLLPDNSNGPVRSPSVAENILERKSVNEKGEGAP